MKNPYRILTDYRKRKALEKRVSVVYLKWQEIYLEILDVIIWAEVKESSIQPVQSLKVEDDYIWINPNSPYLLGIPMEWLEDLAWEDDLRSYLNDLYAEALITRLEL